jgi:hypothetical protein
MPAAAAATFPATHPQFPYHPGWRSCPQRRSEKVHKSPFRSCINPVRFSLWPRHYPMIGLVTHGSSSSPPEGWSTSALRPQPRFLLHGLDPLFSARLGRRIRPARRAFARPGLIRDRSPKKNSLFLFGGIQGAAISLSRSGDRYQHNVHDPDPAHQQKSWDRGQHPPENMTLPSARDSMNRPTEKPMLTAWNYAIVHTALQAKRELLERNLNAREVRQHLTLVRLGPAGCDQVQPSRRKLLDIP